MTIKIKVEYHGTEDDLRSFVDKFKDCELDITYQNKVFVKVDDNGDLEPIRGKILYGGELYSSFDEINELEKKKGWFR